MNMDKEKYSWFPENGTCPDTYDSIEEAIKDAQSRYDNGIEEFEEFDDEDTSPIISVGVVRNFDLKDATGDVVDGIEDTMYSLFDDFLFGCDADNGCYISEKDKADFRKEAIDALYPVIEKYVFFNPQWICTPTCKYDLKNRKYVE